jgi:hypothetical protein
LRSSGSPALVDFGAVRSVFLDPGESGSTVVGTYGYMPYEQYMGQASPASDLYALGATMLHLVTGRPPPAFMTEEGRLQVPDSLPCGELLRAVLARMVRPSPAERFTSAREARAALLGGSAERPVVARVGTPPAPAVAPSPAVARLLAELPPLPRPATPALRRLARKIAGSTRELMEPSAQPGASGLDGASLGLLGFFSVITAGVLPLWFLSLSLSRRRRVMPFLLRGHPGTATVVEKGEVDIGFGEKLAKVRFEFEADGRLHVGSDQVMPWITDRWPPGQTVHVLYLPDRDYDSIIVPTA